MSAVKLRDFFENQGHTVLGADRKAQILSTIKSQTTQAPRQTNGFSITRNSWYFKTATTTALAFVLAYILYTPISGPLLQQSGDLLVARQSGIVQAGYVGQLLATQGQINVIRQGITTTTSQLQGGDVVYLFNTSKADFILRDGSRGTIEGPAQLTIVEHQDSGLVLTVDHARYMQIDKNNTTSSDNTTSEELVIETSTSRITTNKDDKVHLALVTTQERQFIQNKGDNLTIESIVPNTASPVSQQLASSHVADVTDNVKVYSQVAMIYDELKTQSSSQTYDLTSDEFESNDLKTLLAINTSSNHQAQPIKQNKPDTILIYQQTQTNDKEPETIHNEISNVDIPVYSDAPTTRVANTALFAMSAIGEDSDQMEIVSSTSLSRQDTAIIGETLAMSDEPIKAKNNVIPEDTGSKITTTTKVPGPLDNKQMRAILSLKSDNCAANIQIKNITDAFDLGSGTSLHALVSSISKDYYLTEELKNLLTTIRTCENDKN